MCEHPLVKFSMGKNVLLSGMIPSLLMLVINCSASGGAKTATVFVLDLLSQLLFLRLSYSVALLWGTVSVNRKHTFDMPTPDFRLT